ncbi:yemanuclein isoform X2 [Culex pipiens pallens]|uniref:yemanuclein isoform X2 n=1 Tax=Culex pipiens pallens TaxID=42434 RepID=UPI001953B8A8|nr:yemanuclein isoform X2 [Culex pipiens pallens]
MSDAPVKKRVALTTIGDVVRKSPFGGAGGGSADEGFFPKGFASQAGSSGAGSGGSGSGKPAKSANRQTIRLELELFEPNAKSFPEFNYSKLVHEAQKRKRKKEKKAAAASTPAGTNGFLSDPDAVDHDDVARLAKELEKKYGAGTAYSSGPSRLDYCDRGAGYDEEDSFIDNTEAYDELIPQEVETVGGGFYINSGALEFKTLSNFERPDDHLRMPKPKKRQLSTTSEESSDEEEEEEEEEVVGKKKQKKVVVPAVKAAKKKEAGGTSGTSGTESAAGRGRKRINGHVGKKQKVGGEEKKSGKVVATVVKDEKKKKKVEKVSGAIAGGGKEVKVMKTTTVKDMLRAKRDSLLKMEQQKKGGRSSGTVSSSEAEEEGGDGDEEDEDGSSEASDSDSSESGSGSESDSDSGSGEGEGGAGGSEKEGAVAKVNGEGEGAKKKSVVKLPDNLPDHLVQDLNSLKEIAKATSGKVNFLDGKVADLLLQIDVTSRMCGGSARNSVYKHLESHLQVSRQTLMIKIKKIRIRKEDNKVKKALDKLETAVKEMMPKLVASFEAEKKKAADLRTAQAAAAASAGTDGTSAEKQPDVKSPKRKFPWNDTLRGLLADIAQIRKQSFHILRPRKETEEEYVQSYLKKSVVPLWPSGWMRFEDLQKELDRRKKAAQKAKEPKKTAVQLNNSSSNGPAKQDSVLSPAPPKQPKLVRTPQASPVPPPPSTSPASKKTSDHSIINIISSPPSQKDGAGSSSSHSSPYPAAQQQQPPRPQSQPPRTSPNFDEDLIKAHVINLETAHSATKTSTAPVPDYLRIQSPALSSAASSASSSRRQSVYQDQPPPMAHASTSTPPNANARKGARKSRDEDSDSSIEIVGEYSMADNGTNKTAVKKSDPLNLAMPTLNKDKYKKLGAGTGSSASSAKSNSSSSTKTTINNNLDKHAGKYGGFALPMTGLHHQPQDLKPTTSVPTPPPPPRSSSTGPNDLDVIRIMRELQELQAIQMAKQPSPKPAHSDSRKSTVSSSAAMVGATSTSSTPPPPRKSDATQSPAQQQQQKQQSHHSSSSAASTVTIDCDNFEEDFLFANYSYDSAKKRTAYK